jgi:hypothetical protein
MSSRWRRFEVLLPLRFNDGSEVPGDWLSEAVLEVVESFGAASYETQKVEGHWRHSGIMYRDDLVRAVVDVPDLPKNRKRMRDFKSRWKSRLTDRALDGQLSNRSRVGRCFPVVALHQDLRFLSQIRPSP